MSFLEFLVGSSVNLDLSGLWCCSWHPWMREVCGLEQMSLLTSSYDFGSAAWVEEVISGSAGCLKNSSERMAELLVIGTLAKILGAWVDFESLIVVGNRRTSAMASVASFGLAPMIWYTIWYQLSTRVLAELLREVACLLNLPFRDLWGIFD